MRKKLKKLKEKGQQLYGVVKDLLTKIMSGAVGKVSAGVLVTVFICLGFSFGVDYGKDGLECNCGYKPPDPKKVRQLITDKSVTQKQLEMKAEKAEQRK